MPQAVAAAAAWVAANAATAAIVALSVASAAYSYTMAKKAKAAQSEAAERKQIIRSSSLPLNYIYGKTRSAGLMAFAQEEVGNQEKGEWVHLVVTHAGHELDRVANYTFNDEPISNFAGNYELKDYPQGATVADQFLLDKCPDWKPTMIGKGLAWYRLSLKFDQERFPTGLPNVNAEKFGYRVPDPRTGEVKWTDNPALCILHYLKNKLKWEDEYIIEETFVTSANICDEIVVNNDGSSERRYTIGCEFDDSDTPASVLEKMLATCGGEWIRVGGRLGLRVAAYYGPAVVSITEDDLISGIEIQPEVERQDAFNIVRGTYIEPNQNYTEIDYPEVRVAQWVTDDEEEIVMDFDLSYVQSPWQAQRLADIALKRNRLGMTMKLPCNLRGFQCVPGTMIKLSLPTIGFNEAEFMVVDWDFSVSGGVSLVVRRDLPDFYDDAVGVPVVTPPLINLPTGGVPAPSNPLYIAKPIGDIVQGVISWTNTVFRISHTNVVVKDITDTVIQSESIPFPGNEMPLNGKLAGTYSVELQAVGVNTAKSPVTVMSVVISAPTTPDFVTTKTSNWSINLVPGYNLGTTPFGTLFEFYVDSTLQVTPPADTRKPDEVASSWNQGGLTPDTYYYYWIRAVNSYGKSGWIQQTVKTTRESALVETLVEKLIGIEIYAPYIASGEGPNPAFVLDGRPDHGNGLIKGAKIQASEMVSTNYVPGNNGYKFTEDGGEINEDVAFNGDISNAKGTITAAKLVAKNIVGDIASVAVKIVGKREETNISSFLWTSISISPQPYSRWLRISDLIVAIRGNNNFIYTAQAVVNAGGKTFRSRELNTLGTIGSSDSEVLKAVLIEIPSSWGGVATVNMVCTRNPDLGYMSLESGVNNNQVIFELLTAGNDLYG